MVAARKADAHDEAHLLSLQGDAVEGGVNGTPSFWVLGPKGKAELIQGAFPFTTFQAVFDGMLKLQ